MDHTLKVQDLMLPGEPLDPAEVLACEDRLSNPVSWVVSLRPYPPAFPRLRGGELALVATEHLTRLDPPTTLADVVRQLASREAAAVAVRGSVDAAAIEAAQRAELPLLRLQDDAPMHDIEQAVMRVCALYQVRREILPEDAGSEWVVELLEGRIASSGEAHSYARKKGYKLAANYAVAYVTLLSNDGPAHESRETERILEDVKARVVAESVSLRYVPVTQPMEGGLAVLLPSGSTDKLLGALTTDRTACGIGREKPLLDAPSSFEEARLAVLASALLYNGGPARYDKLGADRLLMLLYRDRPDDLRAFVDETLGPLLRYDNGSFAPMLPTLRSFITHGGRLRETASDIFVHRNTLAYRLDRAAEILGVNLKDPDERLAIELALRALPLVDISQGDSWDMSSTNGG